MSEQKDYTKFTLKQGEYVEMSKDIHTNIKKAYEMLWSNYEEEKPGTYSHNGTIMSAYLLMHKTNDGDKVLVEGSAFEKVRNFTRKLLDKETRVLSDIKFDIINTKTSKVVKSIPKGKSEGEGYKTVFSPEKTLDRQKNTPKQWITTNGQTLLNISQELDNIFINNIDAGKGITFEELAEQNKEPKMDVVNG